MERRHSGSVSAAASSRGGGETEGPGGLRRAEGAPSPAAHRGLRVRAAAVALCSEGREGGDLTGFGAQEGENSTIRRGSGNRADHFVGVLRPFFFFFFFFFFF